MVEKNKRLIQKARPGEMSIRGTISRPDITGTEGDVGPDGNVLSDHDLWEQRTRPAEAPDAPAGAGHDVEAERG